MNIQIQICEYQKEIINKIAAFHHCTSEEAAQGVWDEQLSDFAQLLERIENDLAEAQRKAFYIVK